MVVDEKVIDPILILTKKKIRQERKNMQGNLTIDLEFI